MKDQELKLTHLSVGNVLDRMFNGWGQFDINSNFCNTLWKWLILHCAFPPCFPVKALLEQLLHCIANVMWSWSVPAAFPVTLLEELLGARPPRLAHPPAGAKLMHSQYC